MLEPRLHQPRSLRVCRARWDGWAFSHPGHPHHTFRRDEPKPSEFRLAHPVGPHGLFGYDKPSNLGAAVQVLISTVGGGVETELLEYRARLMRRSGPESRVLAPIGGKAEHRPGIA